MVFFAQKEAVRLGCNEVDTEHLLLGLIRETDSVADRILIQRIGAFTERIRASLERQAPRGPGHNDRDMRLTPAAKRVIDLAYEEARRIGNNYVGSEHLLLGLILEREGLAARVLAEQGVDPEGTRREVEAMQNESA
jgi:ATP-dependent Clp protease ATP-binding subunit ClpC